MFPLTVKFGSSARPRSPRSQKSWTFVRRSARTVGVVSVRLSKTFTRPLFSATTTRPSGAKRTAVGAVSPLNATDSVKPAGTAAASTSSAVAAGSREASNALARGSACAGTAMSKNAKRAATSVARPDPAVVSMWRPYGRRSSSETGRWVSDRSRDPRTRLGTSRGHGGHTGRRIDHSGRLVPRHQRWQWVERVAAVVPAGGGPHLEVEVAGGRIARTADVAEQLARPDAVANVHDRGLAHVHVGVVDAGALAVDHEVVAGAGVVLL